MDAAAPIVLESRRLKVEVAQPGTVYHRTRFDWSGLITQVTLDGSHTFCVPEDHDPAKGTGGIGLCAEFGIEKAIGYVDAKPGEPFPKLGIGLLKRPQDANYRFFVDHEIASLFPIEIEILPNQARFVVEPLECRGYAVRLTKTLSVNENWLTIAYHLENRGSQPVHTHEYCHNFIGIDNQPVGVDYRLSMPYAVTLERNRAAFRGFLPPLLRRVTPDFVLDWLVKRMAGSSVVSVNGSEIGWKAAPKGAFYCRPLGFFQTEQAQWSLVHTPSAVAVREYDDFLPARVVLWGAGHVISPEVYIDIDVEPGESQAWTRRYEFLD